MRRDLLTSLIAVVVLTVLLGLLYPLVITGVTQVVFPGTRERLADHAERQGRRLEADRPGLPQAGVGKNGKPEQDSDGNPVLARTRVLPGAALDADLLRRERLVVLEPRPEQHGRCATTFKSNLDAYLKLEQPYDPGLTAAQVPVDAVTSSASGVDPDISRANADIQAHRVAAVRHLPLAQR